jgi:nicotinic acid mononucleotide adenylyltransferase
MSSPKRRRANPQLGHVVAITGSSCSGKSTLTRKLLARLQQQGIAAELVEQDRHKAASPVNKLADGRRTWEGPQFTNWHSLHEATSKARESSHIVLLDGYMVLDPSASPPLIELIDGVLWVQSTEELVMARRKSYPRSDWKSAAEYVSTCIWPAHLDHVSRIGDFSAVIQCRDELPASDDAEQRLRRAYTVLSESWLPKWRGDGGCSGEKSTPFSGVGCALGRGGSSSAAAVPGPPPATPPPASSSSALLSPAASSADTPFAADVPRGTPFVLATHGSFNPVHVGHVDMMLRAREELVSRGFNVVGGRMAITDASHIRSKPGGVTAMADATRLRLLELACADHGWLRHCGGQGVYVKSNRRYFEKQRWEFGPDVSAALVDGSDVFLRYQWEAPPVGTLLIVVARHGQLTKARRKLKELGKAASASTLILPPASDGSAAAEASSTLVRELLRAPGADRAELVRLCGQQVAEALLKLR